VNGIRLDNGSFLALQVTGCSEPNGLVIQRDKEDSKTNDAISPEVEGADDHEDGPKRHLSQIPEILDLTGEYEPDYGIGSVEVIDTNFEVLGDKRPVIDVRRDSQKNGSGKGGARSSNIPSIVSAGDPHGSNKGIGQANIFAQQVMESHGMLRDMWDAMLYLQKKYPLEIMAVEWLSVDKQFRSTNEPQLIPLTPFDTGNKTITTKTRNWLYFDVTNKIPRGVLVARLVVNRKDVYVVEIQRRSRFCQDENGASIQTEESFKGLIFSLDHEQSLKSWITTILAEIRTVYGVVQEITGQCPGNAATFKHSSSSGDGVYCQTTMLNALKKIGIIIT